MNAVGTKDGAQHERNGNERAADLIHRLDGGVSRREAGLQVSFDIFHHHDRVVDDDADREHEPEEREIIQREPKRRHDGKGADERHGNREDRNQRRPPGLQKPP